jgi:hypothetical protein
LIFLKEHYFKRNLLFISDSITVESEIPWFLTKEYRNYDPKRVVSNDIDSDKLYQKHEHSRKKHPFDGLNTWEHYPRVTIGNNQNTVLNSNLDLQITGKLSEKLVCEPYRIQ